MLIQVQGTPRPQPRPRVVKGRAVSCADKNARAWIARVEHAARSAHAGQAELSGGLVVRLAFRFPTETQARQGQAHLATPDADNLAKLALDCLQRAGVIRNDSQIWSLEIRKAWSSQADAGMDAWVFQELPGAGQGPGRPGWLG